MLHFKNFEMRAYTLLRNIASSQATYLTIFAKLMYAKRMANYHLKVKAKSRKDGRSCVAALAYRTATMLVDQRTGETHDYRRKENVEYVEICVLNNFPNWIKSISEECQTSREETMQKLSDIFEAAEKRRDGRVYREIEFSLPRELNKEQNIAWAREFIRDTCLAKGMVAIMAYHFDIDKKTGEVNPHCHVLLSTRELTKEGFSPYKQRDWDKKELVQEWREQYAQYQNAALKQHGFEVRVDHRSLEDRGLHEIDPQSKRGKDIDSMMSRGIKTDKQSAFDVVRLKNQFKILKNPELVLSIVTANHSTFTHADIAKVLHRYINDPQQFQTLYSRLTGSKELVLLRSTDSRQEPVYTTQEMLRIEMGLVRKAESMAVQQTHKVDPKIIEGVIANQNQKLEAHGGLSKDQVRAIRHMLSSDQLSCVVGYAGAGKTTALEAAHEGWTKAGYAVIGLAPTGKAARNIEDSGIRSMTLHQFLLAQDSGREKMSPKTVLVLDEAGMVDSRRMGELISLADRAGAKIVTMGDGAQLQAVEAGPAFRLLTDRVQPAVLETVVRQKVDWQRDATQLFGRLQTRAALNAYRENGCLTIVQEQAPALNDAKFILDNFCLARQLSGRIWNEMREDVQQEISKTIETDPKTVFSAIAKRQDFNLHQDWKSTREAMVLSLIEHYDSQQEVLKERGVDINTLTPLVAQYKSSPERDLGAFNKIEELMRQMSYEHTYDMRAATRQAMVASWANDLKASPDQSHLMLAFTNKDANKLNEEARGLMREHGAIQGLDYQFVTQRIEKDDFGEEERTYHDRTFAQGDRLLFTHNDNGLNVKNGSLGTIQTIGQKKITVKLDGRGDQEGEIISFSPNLYPFIDNGWATTIHKAQGVTVDHVKFLASFEEYRNLAYVGMSRHRHSLKIFGSNLDFWREEKIIDRLSRVQEKLSGFDYLDPESLLKLIKQDESILWHEKKLQQGRDLWNAVKVTAYSAFNQLLDQPSSTKVPEESFKSLDDSEEKRSHEIFKFQESLLEARTRFEAKHQQKYFEACEFFEFEQRYGRAPKPNDQPTVQMMSEELTRLAGRLYQEQALKDGKLPDPYEVSKQAYQEFALRPEQEATLADRLCQGYAIPLETAQTMAKIMLTQKDITTKELTKADEANALKLAEYARERSTEMIRGEDASMVAFRIDREVAQLQSHTLKYGTIPANEGLKDIQEKAQLEMQEIKMRGQLERQEQVQILQSRGHGLGM